MIGQINLSQSFGDTLRYVLDRQGVSLVYDNVAFNEQPCHKAIALSMRDTAELNYRTDKPCFHLSISPAESDELTIEDWEDLTEDLLTSMGWDDQQAIAVLHTDEEFPSGKPRPHVHIVGNLIDENGDRANTDFSKYRLQESLRKLESKYNLTPTASSWEVARHRDTSGQFHRQEKEWEDFQDGTRTEPPEPTVFSQVQNTLDQAVEVATSFEELEEVLANADIQKEFTPHGWKFEKDGIWIAGYQLGKRYAKSAMERKFQADELEQQVNDQSSDQTPTLEELELEQQPKNSDHKPKQRLAQPYRNYLRLISDDNGDSLEFPERDRSIARKLLSDGYKPEEAAIIVAQSPDIQKYPDYKQRLVLTKDVVNRAVDAVQSQQQSNTQAQTQTEPEL
ncbi:relaxase/mobilization nuclease domain-containing protein [Coleofasciculus sp. E1-EBD-02]|uniref:relaxase/mobilization nuclease domain-containing protein n=1 Tax=Coleofasciculus sp. E1-EBD-02 TaxID=3068481 RepID=UPI0032FD1B55